MHNLADFEASRQHRREMAREIRSSRLGRGPRAARQSKGLMARLAGLLERRASGATQAAG